MIIAMLAMMVGGFEEAPLEQVPKGVIKEYKKQLKQYGGATLVKLEREVVAGINYRFTIDINGRAAQLTFWQKLNQKIEFTGFKWVEQ